MKAKKIGVLTFHRGPNYGGYLQAWHMRQAIRNLGHECDVINYQNPVHYAADSCKFVRFSISGMRAIAHKYLKARPFKKCVNELSEGSFTTDSSEVNWSAYDVIVVGSDVIWDYSNAHFGYEKAFFGMAEGQEGCKMISYAASCGPTNCDEAIPEYVREGLFKFSGLAVRDENTYKLTQACTDKEVPIVVDPTWLQEDPRIEWQQQPSEPYILVYGNTLNSESGNLLKNYCHSSSLKLYSASTPGKWADKVFRGIDPLQWVSLFANAEAVVTGTLHGLLYAIKYNKPFILVDNKQTHNKAMTVLNRCELEGHLLQPSDLLNDGVFAKFLGKNAEKPSISEAWLSDSRATLKISLK